MAFEATDAEIRHHSQWCNLFRQLCEFKVESDHCLVPIKYAANLKLGQWVSNQRSNYRLYREGKPNPMTMKRIRELESLGFEWGTSSAACFWERTV